ncbi:carboxylesterase family protein [Salinisphaera sp. SPP-AMP-43]|uniref:carboxylesterase family protein n=1 Tax=Salinisphaera sp. SPP-AMP-43 TaxID=3121288 RepID=UPI003C6E1D8F
MVVVTINHRLGASGLTDLSQVPGGDFSDSANLGIRDLVAALAWVRDNIAAFGGNPDRVTIFGESGGGWKIATLLGVPSAKGLFPSRDHRKWPAHALRGTRAGRRTRPRRAVRARDYSGDG